MSAVERIQAAIDKLMGERNARGYFEMDGYLCEPLTIVEPTLDSREDVAPVTNDELIVTLHRTIDALLLILTHGLARTEAKILHGGQPDAVWLNERDTLALADAILGPEPH